MSEKKKRQDAKVLRQWLTMVNEEGRGLSQWELSFMESLTEQFDRSGSMSERQEEVLERIYSEKTS